MREAFRLDFDSCYRCRSLGVGLVLQGSRVDSLRLRKRSIRAQTQRPAWSD